MSAGVWVLIYLAVSLMCKWILSWGGADCIKGWKSIFFFNGSPEEWNTEQLRAMALFLWIGFTVLFLIGLIYPEFRCYRLKSCL
ncbi:hypothetical protein CDG60_01850 [Acinetobacter chinensis]|jgi:hypothetical protein|uniref:Uncharacterized protein n=1 Tax=Acinetobacter chinensis TaxID=2004650 RepID=A0A3B7LYQ8_9GAMM|nr:hypothetical protein [Acinetobacter chinensis]AXY55453.1 hypothetical protein CDG60_01850 [Acinetobacter chinensis]WOE41773.1 hypothetical protein QSG87_01035 [Acinetobacter chinensis]